MITNQTQEVMIRLRILESLGYGLEVQLDGSSQVAWLYHWKEPIGWVSMVRGWYEVVVNSYDDMQSLGRYQALAQAITALWDNRHEAYMNEFLDDDGKAEATP